MDPTTASHLMPKGPVPAHSLIHLETPNTPPKRYEGSENMVGKQTQVRASGDLEAQAQKNLRSFGNAVRNVLARIGFGVAGVLSTAFAVTASLALSILCIFAYWSYAWAMNQSEKDQLAEQLEKIIEFPLNLLQHCFRKAFVGDS